MFGEEKSKEKQRQEAKEGNFETLLLKVHKIENFFDFDFEICTISLLVMSKKILRFYRKIFLFVRLLEELRFFRAVLGLRRMKKILREVKNFFLLFSLMNPLYEPIVVFRKFDLFTA
jgi:hypothetical protein